MMTMNDEKTKQKAIEAVANIYGKELMDITASPPSIYFTCISFLGHFVRYIFPIELVCRNAVLAI
jgi:hypothetical protein